MEGLIMTAQLLLSLSILIVVHEWGHFFAARTFNIKVEKFYLFFDFLFPMANVLNFSLIKWKKGDTEYGVGWFPLGGYVKIAGMVDESMDKEQMKQPPQPWEFRSKPAWQRLIIMLGGVTMNVLLAFFIYAMILFTWGEKKIPISSITNGVSVADSLMYEMGFKDGDKIIAVNDEIVTYYDDIPKKLILGEKVLIERDGKEQTINLPVNLIGKLVAKKRKGLLLFLPRTPVIAEMIPDTSNAAKAGLKQYDRIIRVDSVKTDFFDEYKTVMEKNRGKQVQLVVQRNSRQDTLTAQVTKDGNLGFYSYRDPESLDSLGYIKIEKKQYGF